ncbi:DUF2339 domain-containing protein [Parabacteroides distasonis]|uniref:DUF2339 domain-containing protein n=1 Tax=Parabacteroides distasonis TaxID=823 RepID=UPI0038F7813B
MYSFFTQFIIKRQIYEKRVQVHRIVVILTNKSVNKESFSDSISISLSLAGFMQMAVGMRLHLKVVWMISLATFSIVLLKLVMVDLCLLPTIRKVVVFIILGVILLGLFFLYQKLKTAMLMITYRISASFSSPML